MNSSAVDKAPSSRREKKGGAGQPGVEPTLVGSPLVPKPPPEGAVVRLVEEWTADQRLRWQKGERVPAEEYLQRSPGLQDAPEAFPLIYAEFLLREDFGELRVDRAAHRAFVSGSEVSLTALEFRLLMMLHDRRGRVLSRDLLLDEVWGAHADVTSRNVDTNVKRVREKLGAAGDYIETVRGVGYRFRSEPGETNRE